MESEESKTGEKSADFGDISGEIAQSPNNNPSNGNGDNNLTSDGGGNGGDGGGIEVEDVDEKGSLSPLTGSYLLIILAEPHSDEDRDIIINRLTKGLKTWDLNLTHVDLNCELLNLANSNPEGDEARNGEKLVQWASENLVVEVLIHSQVSTLLQCMKNLLASFTRSRHIIHGGYAFQGSGSWILQDGTFSSTDFIELWDEPEVQRILAAYKGDISVSLHCASENGWSEEKLRKEPFAKQCQIQVNPPEGQLGQIHSSGIISFVDFIGKMVVPSPIKEILEPSEIVGNIRFTHPTLYVFPGGQGDSALFGINGFNMLIDGGFARRACFWDFTRHLDRLDAVLLTRLNNNSLGGISSILERKNLDTVYPQIGHFFGNLVDKKSTESGEKGTGNGHSKEKDKEDLIISLTNEGHRMLELLKLGKIKPHLCFRENIMDPINLYHKVGHGKLDLYILNPTKDSREIKEFLQKWNNELSTTNKMTLRTDGKDFNYPLLNLVSICALLVWQPANPRESITRLLFPGSTPQAKIFDSLNKLKHLEFLKYPVCSAKSLMLGKKSRSKSEHFSESKITKSSVILENSSSNRNIVSAVQKSSSGGSNTGGGGILTGSSRSRSVDKHIAIRSESVSTEGDKVEVKKSYRKPSKDRRNHHSQDNKLSDGKEPPSKDSSIKKVSSRSSTKSNESPLPTSKKTSSGKVPSSTTTKKSSTAGDREKEKDGSSPNKKSPIEAVPPPTKPHVSSKYGIHVSMSKSSRSTTQDKDKEKDKISTTPPSTTPQHKSAKEEKNRKVSGIKSVKSEVKSRITEPSKIASTTKQIKPTSTTAQKLSVEKTSSKSTAPGGKIKGGNKKVPPPSCSDDITPTPNVGLGVAAEALVSALEKEKQNEEIEKDVQVADEVVKIEVDENAAVEGEVEGDGEEKIDSEIVQNGHDHDHLGLNGHSNLITESSSELSSLEPISVDDEVEPETDLKTMETPTSTHTVVSDGLCGGDAEKNSKISQIQRDEEVEDYLVVDQGDHESDPQEQGQEQDKEPEVEVEESSEKPVEDSPVKKVINEENQSEVDDKLSTIQMQETQEPDSLEFEKVDDNNKTNDGIEPSTTVVEDVEDVKDQVEASPEKACHIDGDVVDEDDGNENENENNEMSGAKCESEAKVEESPGDQKVKSPEKTERTEEVDDKIPDCTRVTDSNSPEISRCASETQFAHKMPVDVDNIDLDEGKLKGSVGQIEKNASGEIVTSKEAQDEELFQPKDSDLIESGSAGNDNNESPECAENVEKNEENDEKVDVNEKVDKNDEKVDKNDEKLDQEEPETADKDIDDGENKASSPPPPPIDIETTKKVSGHKREHLIRTPDEVEELPVHEEFEYKIHHTDDLIPEEVCEEKQEVCKEEDQKPEESLEQVVESGEILNNKVAAENTDTVDTTTTNKDKVEERKDSLAEIIMVEKIDAAVSPVLESLLNQSVYGSFKKENLQEEKEKVDEKGNNDGENDVKGTLSVEQDVINTLNDQNEENPDQNKENNDENKEIDDQNKENADQMSAEDLEYQKYEAEYAGQPLRKHSLIKTPAFSTTSVTITPSTPPVQLSEDHDHEDPELFSFDQEKDKKEDVHDDSVPMLQRSSSITSTTKDTVEDKKVDEQTVVVVEDQKAESLQTKKVDESDESESSALTAISNDNDKEDQKKGEKEDSKQDDDGHNDEKHDDENEKVDGGEIIQSLLINAASTVISPVVSQVSDEIMRSTTSPEREIVVEQKEDQVSPKNSKESSPARDVLLEGKEKSQSPEPEKVHDKSDELESREKSPDPEKEKDKSVFPTESPGKEAQNQDQDTGISSSDQIPERELDDSSMGYKSDSRERTPEIEPKEPIQKSEKSPEKLSSEPSESPEKKLGTKSPAKSIDDSKENKSISIESTPEKQLAKECERTISRESTPDRQLKEKSPCPVEPVSRESTPEKGRKSIESTPDKQCASKEMTPEKSSLKSDSKESSPAPSHDGSPAKSEKCEKDKSISRESTPEKVSKSDTKEPSPEPSPAKSDKFVKSDSRESTPDKSQKSPEKVSISKETSPEPQQEKTLSTPEPEKVSPGKSSLKEGSASPEHSVHRSKSPEIEEIKIKNDTSEKNEKFYDDTPDYLKYNPEEFLSHELLKNSSRTPVNSPDLVGISMSKMGGSGAGDSSSFEFSHGEKSEQGDEDAGHSHSDDQKLASKSETTKVLEQDDENSKLLLLENNLNSEPKDQRDCDDNTNGLGKKTEICEPLLTTTDTTTSGGTEHSAGDNKDLDVDDNMHLNPEAISPRKEKKSLSFDESSFVDPPISIMSDQNDQNDDQDEIQVEENDDDGGEHPTFESSPEETKKFVSEIVDEIVDKAAVFAEKRNSLVSSSPVPPTDDQDHDESINESPCKSKDEEQIQKSAESTTSHAESKESKKVDSDIDRERKNSAGESSTSTSTNIVVEDGKKYQESEESLSGLVREKSSVTVEEIDLKIVSQEQTDSQVPEPEPVEGNLAEESDSKGESKNNYVKAEDLSQSQSQSKSDEKLIESNSMSNSTTTSTTTNVEESKSIIENGTVKQVEHYEDKKFESVINADDASQSLPSTTTTTSNSSTLGDKFISKEVKQEEEDHFESQTHKMAETKYSGGAVVVDSESKYIVEDKSLSPAPPLLQEGKSTFSISSSSSSSDQATFSTTTAQVHNQATTNSSSSTSIHEFPTTADGKTPPRRHSTLVMEAMGASPEKIHHIGSPKSLLEAPGSPRRRASDFGAIPPSSSASSDALKILKQSSLGDTKQYSPYGSSYSYIFGTHVDEEDPGVVPEVDEESGPYSITNVDESHSSGEFTSGTDYHHQHFTPIVQQQHEQLMDEQETYSSGDFSDSQLSTAPSQQQQPALHYGIHHEIEQEVVEKHFEDIANGNSGNSNQTQPMPIISSTPSTTGTTGTTSHISQSPSSTSMPIEITPSKIPHHQIQSSGNKADTNTDSEEEDLIKKWGKPLGLPAIFPSDNNNLDPPQSRLENRGTPAKSSSGSAQVRRTHRSTSSSNKSPIYVDLAYVPHHGNSNYCDSEFFRLIRSRYYVFSGIEPSREVFEGLLKGKQAWEEKDKNLETTIIPTYDTDTLGYWVVDSEESLAQAKIDLAPSAIRCSINLQDHETSCSAYRLEF